ncbi:MAG: hypothetical protein QM296_10725 [Bacillota bacterium]|nr:hypothetical protein [Bacillota bacterium]
MDSPQDVVFAVFGVGGVGRVGGVRGRSAVGGGQGLDSAGARVWSGV